MDSIFLMFLIGSLNLILAFPHSLFFGKFDCYYFNFLIKLVLNNDDDGSG